MNRRLRLLGALIALLAFSAYFAEGVWAAACMPGMDDSAAAHSSPKGHAGMDHSPASPDENHDSPRCPPGMTGMGSSCVAVSLPAAIEVPTPAAEGTTIAHTAADDLHDSLLTAGHFRPPRA